MGEVESIAADYIEVKEGKLDKKHYYVPKIYVDEFDGKKLHVTLTKDEIKDKFEKDNPPFLQNLNRRSMVICPSSAQKNIQRTES